MKLIFEKFNGIWGDELFGSHYSNTTIDSTKLVYFITPTQLEMLSKMMSVISQFYYFGILVFSLFGCYRLKNKKLSIGMRFLFTTFVIFVLLHSFLEVQSRYHYPCEIIFLILGGYGIGGKSVVPLDC